MMNAPDIENQNPNPETAAQPNAPAQGDAENSLPAETEDTGSTGKDSVNLQRAFSKINTALIALADNSGARRSISLPHVEGETTAQHFAGVGQAASQVGGLTTNLILAEHSKHGANGGETVGYSAAKLREILIPKNDADAIAAIDATRAFVSKAAKLLGKDNSIVQAAQSQIGLISEHDGEGMTVADLIIACVNIPHPLIQNVARLHAAHKHGPQGHVRLTAPKN